MSNYDQKMVSDWKDDLQNLLVFVSICVTNTMLLGLIDYTG